MEDFRIVEHVELSGPGLLLRPWRDADAVEVMLAMRELQIALWNASPDTAELAGALGWVRRRADWSTGQHASFAVVDPVRQTLLGSISLHRIHDGEAEIGYWTVAAARGRGVATGAVGVVAGWAFEKLELHRIELCHAVANPASCRVAERAGFRLEGELRQSHRYGDGQRYDEHLHARLATDQ